ncbi:MAG: hypothetical protein JWM19_5211 [Actinomycetia bacterium]|nr:hypothetical protein [Actinomycetes bacterium]
MTTSPDRLDLLAHPLTGALLGDVVIYDFPPQVGEAWKELVARFRQITGSNANLPFGALVTALRASTGRCINMYPASKDQPPRTLVASGPLDKDDVRDAVTIWEQVILGTDPSQVRFGYPSRLADAISEIPPVIRPLSREITRGNGLPDAPGWVYDVASWHAAERLISQPWTIDEKQVKFRMDTRGDLLVWDEALLWSHAWREGAEPRYAAARIRLAMKTLPWMSDPALIISPSVFRVANRISNARTAWLEPNDPASPLLILHLSGRYGQMDVDRHTRTVLEIWSRLRGEQELIPSTADLRGRPGRLRPLIPAGVRYPIGRGLGMHSTRELVAHTSEVLGVPPLTVRKIAGHQFHRKPEREGGRDPELLDPNTIGATITASGAGHLRIVVLYQFAHTRRRIQNLLAYHFADLAFATASIQDGSEVRLGSDAVTAVFREARDLLTHGEHGQRKRLLSGIQALYPPDGTRVVALCETEYDPKEWAERRVKSRFDSSIPNPDDIDAKHVVNKLLAMDGVASQFIATREPAKSGSGSITTEEELAATAKDDYPGHSAVADLLRTAGLVHARLGEALAFGRRYGISTPHAFIGLHLREQRKNKRHLSITLAALIPDGNQWGAWGYAWNPHPYARRTGWMRYNDANVAYRANDLLRASRHSAWDDGVPDIIDIALSQLAVRLGGMPYILVVSGEASRTIWPGMANKHLGRETDPHRRIDGRPALPGPRDAPPAAVIRVTPGPGEVPRPVPGITRESGKAVRTTNALYEQDHESGDPVLVLASVPRQYDGNGRHRRIGSQYSRWSAAPGEQPQTWYAHTSTEILVRSRPETALQYGIAAARLCDHAISWDGRTRYPAPLHLAMQMDRDHPEYRRTIDLDEEDTDFLDDDDLAEPDAAG